MPAPVALPNTYTTPAGVQLIISAPPPGDTVPQGGSIPASMTMTAFDVNTETVPIMGNNYNKSMAVIGPWSQGSTWTGGTVPLATDSVLIQTGGTVTIDNASAVCKNLIVQGTVFFARTGTTKLLVNTLTTIDNGVVDMGTDAQPITGFAELVYRNSPIDIANDPNQYSNGFVGLGGDLLGKGTFKTPHVRLGAEIAATSNAVTLGSAVTNWQPGDRVVVPDTRHLGPTERGGILGGTFTPQWEERIINTIAGNGLSLTVTVPFTYNHRGPRDRAGTLETYPHIINLTRNVVIRSENVAAVTGHMIFMMDTRVQLKNCLLYEMGRTTNADLTSINPATGFLNKIARYGCHFHHCHGKVGDTYTFRIEGCAIDGGPTNHDLKWGLTVHDTSYGFISNNCMYNFRGAGMMFEQGNEYHNQVEDNVVVRSTGRGARPDFDDPQNKGKARMGAGYYFRGPMNILRRNVSCNCHGSQVTGAYGFLFFFGSDGFFLVGSTGVVRVPAFVGGDTMQSGQYLSIDPYSAAIDMQDCETYANMSGWTIWSLGTVSGQPRPNPAFTTITNMKMWHCWEYGFFMYEVKRLRIDGFWVRNDIAQIASASSAWVGSDYFFEDVIVSNVDVQNCREGFHWSVGGPGPAMIRDGTIYAVEGFVTQTPWSSSFNASFIPDKTVTLKNLVFGPHIIGQTWNGISRAYVPATGDPAGNGQTESFRALDNLYVEDAQGVSGDNFRCYYTQQDPNFVMPSTVIYDGSGGGVVGQMKVEGSPNPGQTNAQLFATLGISIAGAVATCTITRPNIIGYCCSS